VALLPSAKGWFEAKQTNHNKSRNNQLLLMPLRVEDIIIGIGLNVTLETKILFHPEQYPEVKSLLLILELKAKF